MFSCTPLLHGSYRYALSSCVISASSHPYHRRIFLLLFACCFLYLHLHIPSRGVPYPLVPAFYMAITGRYYYLCLTFSFCTCFFPPLSQVCLMTFCCTCVITALLQVCVLTSVVLAFPTPITGVFYLPLLYLLLPTPITGVSYDLLLYLLLPSVVLDQVTSLCMSVHCYQTVACHHYALFLSCWCVY